MPKSIHEFNPRAWYPLADRDYGKFSAAKDSVTFHIRTDSDLLVLPLAGKALNLPLLRVQTPRFVYRIRFHHHVKRAADTLYALGALLVIDPRSVAAEARQSKDPWKAGCSFNVQKAHRSAWRMAARRKLQKRNLCSSIKQGRKKLFRISIDAILAGKHGENNLST